MTNSWMKENTPLMNGKVGNIFLLFQKGLIMKSVNIVFSFIFFARTNLQRGDEL